MMQWLQDNWDKLLTAFLSILISGIVGFFTAVLSIKSDMADVKERMARLETQTSNVMPKFATLDDASKNIVGLQRDVKDLQQSTNNSSQLATILVANNNTIRGETLKAIGELFDEYVRSHPVTRAAHK